MKRILITTFVLAMAVNAAVAQEDSTDFFTVGGVVRDARTRKVVEYVNVSAADANIGTVTNEDGEFILKINKSLNVKNIRLSCLGYFNALITVSGNENRTRTYYLTPESYVLGEVNVLSWKDPRALVEAAMEKIEQNYALIPNMLTGFYRETVRKRRNYINISEAVIELYKDGYDKQFDRDQVKILKGRKLISPKKSDTLSVKILGGPSMPIYLDLIKNHDILLNAESLQQYRFTMGEATSIDDRLHFVVNFEPLMLTPYPLYFGTLYIDRETLSFTRAELRMDMRDKQKVTSIILRDKPAGLRFNPEEVSYIITYKQQDNKTYLNYIRNDIRFKCDWKRRLFATNYAVTGETVITDRTDSEVKRIPGREAFTLRNSLSHEVAMYQDENFWSSYNIIEPTESLENAVNKLKKAYQ